jgi:hypothetical protein
MKEFKKDPKKHLNKVLTIITGAILLFIVSAFTITKMAQEKAMPSNTPNSHDTLLVLRDSGSTNFPGYTITVKHDGSGTLTYDSGHGDTRPQFNTQNKTFSPQTFQIASIRQILSQIGTIKNVPNHSCIKSISFGTVVTITYNGQTSGDISCIDSSDPQAYQNLKKEVETLMSKAIR